MDQVYITNLEQTLETLREQAYSQHRIAEGLDALVSEMRYANAIARTQISPVQHKQLKDQGY